MAIRLFLVLRHFSQPSEREWRGGPSGERLQARPFLAIFSSMAAAIMSPNCLVHILQVLARLAQETPLHLRAFASKDFLAVFDRISSSTSEISPSLSAISSAFEYPLELLDLSVGLRRQALDSVARLPPQLSFEGVARPLSMGSVGMANGNFAPAMGFLVAISRPALRCVRPAAPLHVL